MRRVLLTSRPSDANRSARSPYETPPDDSPRSPLPRRNRSASVPGPPVQPHRRCPTTSSSRSSARSRTPTTSAHRAPAERTRATTSWRETFAGDRGRERARSSTGRRPRAAGCMLYLYGESGTIYYYIHLNNDLTLEERQPRQVRQGRRLHREERLTGRGGTADRLRRRLGRRERRSRRTSTSRCIPAAARRQPVPVPAEGLQAPASWRRPGTPFSLTLTGTVASASFDRIAISVTTSQAWPSGLTLTKLNRQITIAVPETTLVQTLAPTLANDRRRHARQQGTEGRRLDATGSSDAEGAASGRRRAQLGADPARLAQDASRPTLLGPAGCAEP